MKKLVSALMTGMVVMIGGQALAHGPMAGFYGGQMAESGDWRVEFAVRDGGLRVWVRDHADQPVAAAGKVTLLAGGQKQDLTLQGFRDGLKADANLKAADKVTAILTLTVDGKPVSARFAQDAVVTPTLSDPAKAGGAVFAANCASCHGSQLRGSDSGPPLLHVNYAPGNGHGDEVILSAASNGAKSHHWKFGDMPKPAGVLPGQEKELLTFIRAMQAANGIVAPPMPANNPHAGHH